MIRTHGIYDLEHYFQRGSKNAFFKLVQIFISVHKIFFLSDMKKTKKTILLFFYNSYFEIPRMDITSSMFHSIPET